MSGDRKFDEPPPGFVVLRESELWDTGRADLWVARGIIDGRSVVRDGLKSRSAACRSAWFSWDDACSLGRDPDVTDIEQVDRVVAEALARKRAVKREKVAEAAERVMRDRYEIERDTWEVMTGALLAQILEETGSIRKAAKHLSVPRATLGAWVRKHRGQGTWPE